MTGFDELPGQQAAPSSSGSNTWRRKKGLHLNFGEPPAWCGCRRWLLLGAVALGAWGPSREAREALEGGSCPLCGLGGCERQNVKRLFVSTVEALWGGPKITRGDVGVGERG